MPGSDHNDVGIGKPPSRPILHVDLDRPHVWIVSRVEWNEWSASPNWHIIGVYTSKERAQSRCAQTNDCVFALPLDEDLPDAICGVDNEHYPREE